MLFSTLLFPKWNFSTALSSDSEETERDLVYRVEVAFPVVVPLRWKGRSWLRVSRVTGKQISTPVVLTTLKSCLFPLQI